MGALNKVLRIGQRYKRRLYGSITFILSTLYTDLAGSESNYEPTIFSGYVSVASDYVYRGISNTDERPNVQLGLDIGHQSGFYASLWLANRINLDKQWNNNQDSYEVDIYVGYIFPRFFNVDTDLSLTRYHFLGNQGRSSDTEYYELQVAFSFLHNHSITLGYSPDTSGYSLRDFAHDEEAFLYNYTWRKKLSKGLEINASVARYDLDRLFSTAYNYWGVGLSKQLKTILMDLSYYNTSDQAEDIWGSDITGERWVLRLTVPLF